MTSTTAPGFTGNCVVVFIVLVHSVFSPVHIGAVEVFNSSEWIERLNLIAEIKRETFLGIFITITGLINKNKFRFQDGSSAEQTQFFTQAFFKNNEKSVDE